MRRGRALDFPRDHGAHLDARTEWWYATGWAGTRSGAEPRLPGHLLPQPHRRWPADNPSRFAARQLLFAHAAVTDLGARRHHHDQRIARWSGAPTVGAGRGVARTTPTVRLAGWWLRREGARLAQRRLPAAGLQRSSSTLERTQPLLLQGDAGFSRKGPEERQASHYYSEPQLAAAARWP